MVAIWAWLQWVFASIIFASILALIAYAVGESACGISLCIGLVLGSLQAFVLRKHRGKQIAMQWVFSTGAGWVPAMFLLVAGDLFVGVGVGLNPETDPKLYYVTVGIIAGALFGLIQSALLPVFRPVALAWAVVNGLAWGLGSFAGGFVVSAVWALTHPHRTPYGMDFPLDPANALIGIVVYGMVSGLGVSMLLYSSAAGEDKEDE